MKVSPLCKAALERAAARKEAQIQTITGDPTKTYKKYAAARVVLEQFARLEIIEHGALDMEAYRKKWAEQARERRRKRRGSTDQRQGGEAPAG